MKMIQKCMSQRNQHFSKSALNEELSFLHLYWEKSSNRIPFLCFEGKTCCGFALIKVEPNNSTRLVELFISDVFQRKGVGSKITKLLFEQFPGKWKIVISSNNTGAIHFLEVVLKPLGYSKSIEVSEHLEIQNKLIFSFTYKPNIPCLKTVGNQA